MQFSFNYFNIRESYFTQLTSFILEVKAHLYYERKHPDPQPLLSLITILFIFSKTLILL